MENDFFLGLEEVMTGVFLLVVSDNPPLPLAILGMFSCQALSD